MSYHSLSTFRVVHGEALQNLLVEVLAALNAAGMVELERVTLDGTRIRAQGGNESFRKGKRIEQHVEEAKKHREALEREMISALESSNLSPRGIKPSYWAQFAIPSRLPGGLPQRAAKNKQVVSALQSGYS